MEVGRLISTHACARDLISCQKTIIDFKIDRNIYLNYRSFCGQFGKRRKLFIPK